MLKSEIKKTYASVSQEPEKDLIFPSGLPWAEDLKPGPGVVHALHNIHDALSPDGILVDTQPVSDRPPVAADGVTLGTLDMREWLDTIQAVDERLLETISAGLYELQHESRFVVTDTTTGCDQCPCPDCNKK